jgi:CubicO group peptidase (beta-lactamase class C family)
LSPAVSNVRAVLVTVDRKPLVQLYRSGTPAQAHDVHSVTKSVIATLIGIALSEERLHSLDDTLATMLPQRAAEMDSTVSAITLRQLLTMTAGLPPDLAKLGQLYLDGGRWNGRQVVPKDWVKASTTGQVTTQGDSAALAESYGYQWWVTQEKGHAAYAAFGFGGQVVEVVPDLRLVVVMATEAAEPNMRWEHVRGLVADAIVPAVGG